VNLRYCTLLIWVLGFAAFPALRAAPPSIAQAEINYLLDFVEHSGCQFYRNGTWYDSKTARAHLQSKYQMLAGSDRINSAEDFIDQAATSSSLSGRPYQVRCGAGDPIASSQWLQGVLSRYRAHDTRDTRGAPANRLDWPSVVVLDHKIAMHGGHVFSATQWTLPGLTLPGLWCCRLTTRLHPGPCRRECGAGP
jgi:Family of unknown function (DUF5329)